ncbi:MAG: thioredoxin domain-containing protein, partial [Flavobacteriales bacterium]|nr:thioredoxin domain-containing protein [Flavobacteriales bacterium]
KSALKNAHFIIENQLRTDGGLNHNYKNDTSNIDGYLEDYCFTIEAFIAMYEATLDEKWLNLSKQLMDYTISHFYDTSTGFFFFTSDSAKDLIARKMELSDNVIPASNSSIAKGLFLLGLHFEDEDYTQKSIQMLKNIENQIPTYVSGYSNWASLLLNHIHPFYEIAICGEKAFEKRKEFYQTYIPNKIIVGTITKSNLPLLRERKTNGNTTIYVCYNKSCQQPVETVDEALKQMNASPNPPKEELN